MTCLRGSRPPPRLPAYLPAQYPERIDVSLHNPPPHIHHRRYPCGLRLSSPRASHWRDLAVTFAYGTCSAELLLQVIQPQVTDPDETHQRALITLSSSRFDKSISLCLTASAASPNVLGLSQGQAEGCRKPPICVPFSAIDFFFQIRIR